MEPTPAGDVGSISRLLDQLKTGDQDAAAALFRRFHKRLLGQLRHRMPKDVRSVSDEYDVALSTFNQFFRDAAEGKFHQLDRNQLWALLTTIARHKTCNLVVHHSRQRRGGRNRANPTDAARLGEVCGPEPEPDEAVIVAEEIERLVNLLGDDSLKTIVILRMEGWSMAEVADQVNCSVRSVRRKLLLVKHIWQREWEGETR
jgi:DNA-directed RNA polymerase specialized sigma24 family protein